MSKSGRRFIGIRHRTKKTAQGEARPTEIHVLRADGESESYSLPDETAELDWVLGRFPLTWRNAEEGEDLSDFPKHHLRERKVRGEDEKVVQVPDAVTGLMPGDTVGMVLGGSGDNLAYAISRRGEEIGARAMRIPAYTLKEIRGGDDKEADAKLLAELVYGKPGYFYEVLGRDRDLIWLRECYQARTDAMKARMACAQRIRSRLIGQIFCEPDGLFPEGDIEVAFAEAKANDMILLALEKEEGGRNKAMAEALEALPVWTELLSKVEGVGPAIAARIISAVGDIRRFETSAKLKAFCGVHVLPNHTFARRRHGEVANWHPDPRQALYLLGDQWVKRKDSEWGQLYRSYKESMRVRRPTPVKVNDTLKPVFRQTESLFLRNNIVIPVDGAQVLDAWELTHYFNEGLTFLPTDDVKVRQEAEEIARKIADLRDKTLVKSTTMLHTDGHIHRSAIWRTVTKFVEWLYAEWWKLEKAREESEDVREVA